MSPSPEATPAVNLGGMSQHPTPLKELMHESHCFFSPHLRPSA
jgi:hypothetical protein